MLNGGFHLPNGGLMDINLPDMDGVELWRLVKSAHPGVTVLLLGTFNLGIYMSKAMENGASGYLLKNAMRQELVDGIKTVSKIKNTALLIRYAIDQGIIH